MLKHRKINLCSYDLAFFCVLSAGLIFIASSFPMMKLRFDIWQHIDHIRAYVLNPDANVTGRATWLKLWAFIFRLFNINDIFAYAVIIHRVQFVLNCVIVYFAARLLFQALLKFDGNETIRAKSQWLSSLALSSVFVWLTIIGTYSFFQQAWIMWYSVNYQITLPMLFLSLGLSVNAIVVPQSAAWVASKTLGAFGLILGVYLFHAGELAYFVIYVLIGLLCFGTKFKLNWRYVVSGGVFLSIVIYALVRIYSDHVPALVTLLKNGEYSKILIEIQTKGKWNAVDGGNRFSANWNELYNLSVFAFIPIFIYGWFHPQKIDKRVLFFLGFSLIFCFIPTFQYSAGLASLISYDGIVNRYYYASFVFLMIPLLAYMGLAYFKTIRHPIGLLAIVFFMMLLVLMYSKKINNEGVYFKNIQSIKNSIKTRKIDIDVSDDFISRVGLKVSENEKLFQSDAYIYCGSFESLYIARYVYRKQNMLFDRLGNYSVADCENYAKDFGKKIAYLD